MHLKPDISKGIFQRTVLSTQRAPSVDATFTAELSSEEHRKLTWCENSLRNPIFRCPPLRCPPSISRGVQLNVENLEQKTAYFVEAFLEGRSWDLSFRTCAFIFDMFL